jgi:hypothetical protein
MAERLAALEALEQAQQGVTGALSDDGVIQVVLANVRFGDAQGVRYFSVDPETHLITTGAIGPDAAYWEELAAAQLLLPLIPEEAAAIVAGLRAGLLRYDRTLEHVGDAPPVCSPATCWASGPTEAPPSWCWHHLTQVRVALYFLVRQLPAGERPTDAAALAALLEQIIPPTYLTWCDQCAHSSVWPDPRYLGALGQASTCGLCGSSYAGGKATGRVRCPACRAEHTTPQRCPACGYTPPLQTDPRYKMPLDRGG